MTSASPTSSDELSTKLLPERIINTEQQHIPLGVQQCSSNCDLFVSPHSAFAIATVCCLLLAAPASAVCLLLLRPNSSEQEERSDLALKIGVPLVLLGLAFVVSMCSSRARLLFDKQSKEVLVKKTVMSLACCGRAFVGRFCFAALPSPIMRKKYSLLFAGASHEVVLPIPHKSGLAIRLASGSPGTLGPILSQWEQYTQSLRQLQTGTAVVALAESSFSEASSSREAIEV